MSEDKQALIQYRLSQAKDSIREAEVLLGGGMSFRSVMNRLYYALFYAVLALLQEKRLAHPNIPAQLLYSTGSL
jgi:uncharacterized protein (UPF0332 family)